MSGLPREVGAGQIPSAKQFNDLLRFVSSLRLRGGPGVRVSHSPGGTTITARVVQEQRSGSANLTHPFQISNASTELGAFINVRLGTVNDIVPIDVSTDLEIESAGTWRVILRVELDIDGIILTTTDHEPDIIIEEDDQPADDDDFAHITLGIVTVADVGESIMGVTNIEQAATHSLRFVACDRESTGETLDERGKYEFWGF